jgi:hypothetical protein
MVLGIGFKMQGVGLRIWDIVCGVLRFKVQGLRCRVQGAGFKVQGLRFRVLRFFELRHSPVHDSL